MPGPRGGRRRPGPQRLRPGHERRRLHSSRARRPRRSSTASSASSSGATARRAARSCSDLQDYADGITRLRRSKDPAAAAWTVNDAIAVTAFIGSIFGNGGGGEVAQRRLPRPAARPARRQARRPGVRRPHGGQRPGRADHHRASASATAPRAPARRRARRSSTRARSPGGRGPAPPAAGVELPRGRPAAARPRGEPLAVMGPQLGYYYPEIVLEADLHGPGINAQGALVPGGSPYVLIGRTRDYAWSLTTATQRQPRPVPRAALRPDGGRATRDSRHYVYKGQCRRDDRRSTPARSTRHQPGRAALPRHGPRPGVGHRDGRGQAATRSPGSARPTARTRSRIAALRDMTLGRGTTVSGFYRGGQRVRLHVQLGATPAASTSPTSRPASCRSGRRARTSCCPRSAPASTTGAASSRWREHPHDVDPPSGLLLNWNNKPAPGWQAGRRQPLLRLGAPGRGCSTTSRARRRSRTSSRIMNKAATEDLRATQVWPVDPRRAGHAARRRAHRARPPTARDLVGGPRRVAPRRRPRRQDRRPRRGDHRPGLHEDRRRRAGRAARAADGGPGRAHEPRPEPTGPQRVVVRRRLVRLRRQGPPDAAGPAGCAAASSCATAAAARWRAAARRCGPRSTRPRTSSPPQQGPDPRQWRADATNERIKFTPGLIPTRCGGRTARRSSRCCASGRSPRRPPGPRAAARRRPGSPRRTSRR